MLAVSDTGRPVLFDLDGTLCESTQDERTFFEAAFDHVGVEPFGAPADLWASLDGPPDPDDRESYLAAGFRRLASKHGRRVDADALAAGLAAAVDHSQVTYRRGAEAAVAATGDRPTGLVTNGPADRQHQKVETLDLQSRLDVIVYAGDLPRRKPHPEPFDAAMERLGRPDARALYVGDSLAYDVAGAQQAGHEAVWVPRGDPDPGEYSPDYVLEDIADLESILD
jgi:putative hydrolase of the HAD superfamily